MRRVISILLILSLVLSYGASFPLRVEATGDDVVAAVHGEYTQSNEVQNITIRITVPGITNAYASLEIDELSLPDGFAFVSYSTSNTNQPISASDYNQNGYLSYSDTNGADTIPADTYYDIVISAPAAAAGRYEIEFGYVAASWNKGQEGIEVEGVSAELLISTPIVPTSDYSIYYELNDGKSDSDGNAHPEYSVDNTVTAEVFIVSNVTDITLQAYDIYLSYDNNLSYQSMDFAATSGAEFKDTNGKLAHIQAVGQDKDKPISIGLTKGTPQSLGTITFKVLDTAIFDTKMPITLTVGESGGALTNIGVGTATSGNPTSYYPQNTGTVEGVEIMDQHTVSFNTDGGTPAIADQTIGHNLTATEPADPEKAGYEFLGWYVGDEAFNFATLITEDVELTAKWTEAMAEYTVKHMQEKLDGTYEVKETAKSSGQTGTSTAAAANTYEGFTAQEITQKTIAADGSTVVEIYYTRNSYTLTWNTGTTQTESEVKYGAAIETLADPEKEGYKFDGWDKEISTMPAENTTINAKWTPITYTVTYTGNGNTGGSMTESTFTYDADGKLAANAFAKTGYTFNGWNTEADGSGTPYADEAEVLNWASEQDEAIELFAQWTPNTYTVIFNGNGATSGEMANQIFTYDVAQNLTANAFVKEDGTYTFAGWKVNNAGDIISDGAEVINLAASGTVTLYAQWTTNYVVSAYTANATQGDVTAQPGTAAEGQTITVTVTPVAGYQVDKVTYIAEAEGAVAQEIPMNGNTGSFTMPAANVRVDATFTAIPYDVTVEQPAEEIGSVGVAGIVDNKATVGEVVELTNTPVPGYELDKYTVKDSSGKDVPVTEADGEYSFTMPADKVTVTATFKPIEYTITYKENGGTDVVDGTYTIEEAVTLPGLDSTTKTGYTFAGWYNNEGLTGDAVTQITQGTIENQTFWAKWTENQYTIKFDNTDLDTSIPDQTVGYDDEVTLPTVTKPGYVLTGWSETKDTAVGTDPQYPIDKPVSKLKENNGDEIILYPVWKYAEYTLSFELGAHPATGATKPADMKFTYNGTYADLPTVQAAPGYNFVGWFVNVNDDTTQIANGGTVAITQDTTVTAKYSAIEYTITFNTNGGAPIADVKYTIESDYELPEATGNGNHDFVNWIVEKSSDTNGWALNAEIEENTAIKGRYGNVTLKAQWKAPFTYAVEEYTYAPNGYVMLRIAASANENGYKFGELEMYYTAEESYRVEMADGTMSAAAFVTLIPMDGNVPVGENGVMAKGELTMAGVNKLVPTNAAVATIERDGDVNGDAVLNIADANIVYQMVKNTGGYYGSLGSATQTDTLSRLKADMDVSMDNAPYRGSLEDVDAIVDEINN